MRTSKGGIIGQTTCPTAGTRAVTALRRYLSAAKRKERGIYTLRTLPGFRNDKARRQAAMVALVPKDAHDGESGGFAGEYQPDFVGTTDPVRQGDLLELPSDDGTEDWSAHFGVLVTANCDLVHKKAGGLLTYVPIVPLEVYLKTVLIPEQLRRDSARIQDVLRRQLEQLGTCVRSDRVIEMLEIGYDTPAIVARLNVAKSSEAELQRHIERVRLHMQAGRALQQPGGSFRDRLRTAVELRRALSALELKPPKASPWQRFERDARDGFGSLPTDYFFVGALSPRHTAGYVAHLRLLRELSHDDIATSPLHERTAHLYRARRVGRMSLLFTHKLVQQMAAVFTDIGLPDEYAGRRTATVDGCLASWSVHCTDLSQE